MKWFFFLVLIPVVTGIVTSRLGVGWFDGDIVTAALINLSVCTFSVATYTLTE